MSDDLAQALTLASTLARRSSTKTTGRPLVYGDKGYVLQYDRILAEIKRLLARELHDLGFDSWSEVDEILTRTQTVSERLLGVAAGASVDEIKRAYRRLAMVYHPDRGGSTADMQRLNAAYADALRRARGTHTAEGQAGE